MIRPGGVGFDVDSPMADDLLNRLGAAERDCKSAVDFGDIVGDEPVEETGRVSKEMAVELGLVGPAARACGLDRDARLDQPSGIYRFSHIPVATWRSGDVFAGVCPLAGSAAVDPFHR